MCNSHLGGFWHIASDAGPHIQWISRVSFKDKGHTKICLGFHPFQKQGICELLLTEYTLAGKQAVYVRQIWNL